MLERKIGDLTIRVTARQNEKVIDLYSRLNAICTAIQTQTALEEAIKKIIDHYQLTDGNLTKTGINSDYHRVMLSLILNFNKCLGATDVSNEWGGINTGNVSRVFTGSKESTAKYIGHFEKCKDTGYRFTEEGLVYALRTGVPEILNEQENKG